MSTSASFCTRYAGKVYPEKKLPFPREFAPGEEDFLFFAKVLVFEEIVDVYNRRMARDERIAPIAREIHWLHHFEEARHLVFGRELVAELFARHRAQWPDEVLRGVRPRSRPTWRATWKEYYNPDAYRDAGLEGAFELRRAALASPSARAHRIEVSQGCLRFLLEGGILEEAPPL